MTAKPDRRWMKTVLAGSKNVEIALPWARGAQPAAALTLRRAAPARPTARRANAAR